MAFMYFITATDVVAFLLPDQYGANVPLFVKATVTNGATNNTFVDSSVNNLAITRNGTPTQGSFSPYDSGWSTYFNSTTTNYLQLPTSNNLTFSANDFTIEIWFNIANDSTIPPGSSYTTRNAYLFASYITSANVEGSMGLGISGNTTTTGVGIFYSIFAGGVYKTNSTNINISARTWHHIAICRSSGVVRLYLDGVNISWTDNIGATNIPNCTNPFWIGRTNHPNYSYPFDGNISNMRFVNGVAVYTANFTPPTAQLTAITGTTLLTCQSNRFKDNSTNNFNITPVGTPSIQVFNPFPYSPVAAYTPVTNGGSSYFNGTTDYLSAPSVTLTSDYTVEGWFYNNGTPNGNVVYGIGGDATGIVFSYVGDNAYFYMVGAGGIFNVYAGAKYCWNHIAVTRTISNNTAKLWLNGVLVSTVSLGAMGNPSGLIGVGKSLVGTAFGPFNGYISDFRILNGTALYTTNFTPPVAPLTAIANTSILVKGTNAGIYDETGNNDITTMGGVSVSTSIKKFTQSTYFDGNIGSYLSMDNKQISNFGANDFTIDFWMNKSPGGAGSMQTMYSSRPNVSSYSTPILIAYMPASASLSIWSSSTGSSWDVMNGFSVTGPLSNSTWYHIAIVRHGSIFTIYVNGVASSTSTHAVTLYTQTYNTIIGGDINSQSSFVGYMENFRITKGAARYTTNFTPPIA
jgi:hypothetical protein